MLNPVRLANRITTNEKRTTTNFSDRMSENDLIICCCSICYVHGVQNKQLLSQLEMHVFLYYFVGHL